VILFCRKDCKEDQLMAAQIYLKLGEVGAESGVCVCVESSGLFKDPFGCHKPPFKMEKNYTSSFTKSLL